MMSEYTRFLGEDGLHHTTAPSLRISAQKPSGERKCQAEVALSTGHSSPQAGGAQGSSRGLRTPVKQFEPLLQK